MHWNYLLRATALAFASGLALGSQASAAPSSGVPPGPATSAAARARGDSLRLLVAYHSDTGNTAAMAVAVGEGAAGVAGVAVVVKPIADIAPEELREADAIVLGSPTHWSNLALPVKAFIDSWPDVVDRVGGAFATGGAPTGGKEHVVTSLVLAMLSHGMVVVGPVYSEGDFRFGASGASAVTGPADPGVSEAELDEARRLGARVAEAALRLRPAE